MLVGEGVNISDGIPFRCKSKSEYTPSTGSQTRSLKQSKRSFYSSAKRVNACHPALSAFVSSTPKRKARASILTEYWTPSVHNKNQEHNKSRSRCCNIRREKSRKISIAFWMQFNWVFSIWFSEHSKKSRNIKG